MRILRIFGIVVAVHLTAFVFVFAIPGCRSTTRRASSERPVVESRDTTLSFPQRKASSEAPGSPFVTGGPLPAPETAVPASGSTIVFPPLNVQSPTRPGTAEAAGIEKTTTPQPRTHVVVARESLWSIAKKYGVTEKELATSNQLRAGAPLRVGQSLVIPVPAGLNPGESVAVPAATFSYRVKAGDSLASIAKRAGITTAQLKELNRLTGDTVRIGQELVLPATPAAIPGGASAAGDATPAKAPKPPKPGMQKHVVLPGETLGEIARRYGVRLSEVATVNHIANPASLRVGAELWIPAPSAKATQPKETTAPAPTPLPTPTPTPVDTPFITPVGGDSPIAPAGDSPFAPSDDGLITPAK